MDLSLTAMQEVVGGSIQIVPLRGHALDGFDVYVNEDGLHLGLPFNRAIGWHRIVGPILVSKADRAGEQVTLTPDEAARIVAILA